MDVLVSKGRPTDVNKFSVTYFQLILTSSSITVDIFALVVSYLFDVWFALNNDDCLGNHIAAMIPFMPIRLYKIHDLS